MTDQKKTACLNCGRTEKGTPLIRLRCSGTDRWICPQCLPVLIHTPQKLADRIGNRDKIRSRERQ